MAHPISDLMGTTMEKIRSMMDVIIPKLQENKDTLPVLLKPFNEFENTYEQDLLMPMHFCEHAVFDTAITDEDFIQRVILRL